MATIIDLGSTTSTKYVWATASNYMTEYTTSSSYTIPTITLEDLSTITGNYTKIPISSHYQAKYLNYTADADITDVDYNWTNTYPIFVNNVNVDSSFYSSNFHDSGRRRSGLVINVRHRGLFDAVPVKIPEQERVALETLREVVTEREFRKYLKYGFILVKGASGATYQIFRNSHHTKVWRGGTLVEEICVRLNHSIKAPPTDNVIAFKTMVEASEESFRKSGNVYPMAKAA